VSIADIAQQLIDEIAALRVLPEMVMRIADYQLGIDGILGRDRRP